MTTPLSMPITLYKANAIAKEPPPDLYLTATECFPTPSDYSEANQEGIRALYKEQAELLFEGLIKTLPGGTIDALLVQFLIHKAGVLVVPYVYGNKPYWHELPRWLEYHINCDDRFIQAGDAETALKVVNAYAARKQYEQQAQGVPCA